MGMAGIWTRDLVVGRQRSYHCVNHAAVKLNIYTSTFFVRICNKFRCISSESRSPYFQEFPREPCPQTTRHLQHFWLSPARLIQILLCGHNRGHVILLLSKPLNLYVHENYSVRTSLALQKNLKNLKFKVQEKNSTKCLILWLPCIAGCLILVHNLL